MQLDENWRAETDVPAWVRSEAPGDFRARWGAEPDLRRRYGSVLLWQLVKPIELLSDAEALWAGFDETCPVAVLCVEGCKPLTWKPEENDLMMAVAAPYLATIRHAVASYAHAWHASEHDGTS